MKFNIGTPDRLGRILFALVIAVLYLTDQISGWAGIVLGFLALVFVVTGFVGFVRCISRSNLRQRKKN